MKANRRTKSSPSSKDLEKENLIKELSLKLEQSGYRVRREKLKQGPGWKTVSGACRLMEDKLVFVDRKSTLDDQLLFLQSVASRVLEVPSQVEEGAASAA